jgi:glycosyltransferase involved in cell wall biosynthesis
MRILIAHESIDTAGGVETYLRAILPELRVRGHDVAVVYHRRRNGQAPTWAEAALFTAGVSENGAAETMSVVRAWRPDVCFSHNMRPLDLERLLVDEWPVVKMMHGYFGTCASSLKMHAFPAPRACCRTFGTACMAMYIPRRCGQLRPRSIVDGFRWAAEQQALFPRYRSIAVASAHMGDEYERHGVPRSRISVLPLFPTIDSPANNPSRDAVLFAGRMTPLKGGPLLIDAVAEASARLSRRIALVMAGDGPQCAEWMARAASLDVAAEFTGWVHGERRSDVFARAAIIAVPSIWPEPFGIVGLEAAALGVPAVAFDVGGIREWLRPGKNGLLVSPQRGATGLADAIVSMLSNDAARGQMSEAARAVAAEMSIAVHASRLESVLDSARH